MVMWLLVRLPRKLLRIEAREHACLRSFEAGARGFARGTESIVIRVGAFLRIVWNSG